MIFARTRSALGVVILAACVAAGPAPAFAEGAPPAGSGGGKAPAPPPSGSGGGAAPAPAQSAFSTEVMVIHATNSGKGIDPRIGNMPELKKPPFSSYDSYNLLSKTRLPLSTNEQKMNLPNGRVLKTKLLGVLPDNEHVKLSASINQPGGKPFLPLLEVKAKVNQSFIVAGPKHKGGILVLVIRVVK